MKVSHLNTTLREFMLKAEVIKVVITLKDYKEIRQRFLAGESQRSIAKAMHISDEQALGYFYSTKTFKQLNDPKYGLQLMSDEYLLEDIQKELSLR